MKLVYFSWVREKIGVGDEELKPPNGITTVEALINWLSKNQLPEQVVFCCFQATDHSLYQDRLIALGMMSADN